MSKALFHTTSWHGKQMCKPINYTCSVEQALFFLILLFLTFNNVMIAIMFSSSWGRQNMLRGIKVIYEVGI